MCVVKPRLHDIQPVVKPVVNRFDNRPSNRFDNRLYRVYSRLSNRLYNPVWQPLERTVAVRSTRFVSDIAVFVLKRDVKLQLTHSLVQHGCQTGCQTGYTSGIVSCKRGMMTPYAKHHRLW